MEKDYQESLDILADRELDDVGKMASRDLQELINSYKQAYDEINKFCISYKQLEKALDMACEKINGIAIDNDYGIGLAQDCINGETSNYLAMCPKDYKEYFLRKVKDE